MQAIRWLIESRAARLIGTFLCGAIAGSVGTSATSAEAAPQVTPPGYFIGVSALPRAETQAAYAAYQAAVDPLARRAGNEPMVRTATVHVLEGDWPYEGRGVLVERYTSLQVLLDFWSSEEYQEVKELREGVLELDFVIAVEGVAP